jgi:hypothetical protein
VKLKTVKREDARVYGLPCRDCMHYIGPQINRAKNITSAFTIRPCPTVLIRWRWSRPSLRRLFPVHMRETTDMPIHGGQLS